MAIKTVFESSMVLINHEPSLESFTSDHAKNLFDEIKKIDIEKFKQIKYVAYSFDSNRVMNLNTVPILCRIGSYLEQYEVKFCLIGDQKISDILQKNGIDRMIYYYPSLDYLSSGGKSIDKAKVKVFLNTLLDSVLMSMKVLIETDVKKSNVSVIKDDSNVPLVEVAAIAGILSAHFSGNVVIGFTDEVFKKAMSVFLQMEVTEITSDIKDGAAELLNVIIGQTKLKLNENGFEIRQVIPNVVTGSRISFSPMTKQSAVLINCESGIGSFIILLTTNTNT